MFHLPAEQSNIKRTQYNTHLHTCVHTLVLVLLFLPLLVFVKLDQCAYFLELGLICVPVLVPVQVTPTSFTHMNVQFMDTHTSTNTYKSVTIKNLVKTVKHLEFLANVNSTIDGTVVDSCLHHSCIMSLLCAV